MEYTLTCNNIDLDLEEGIAIPTDFSIADIKDFSKRARNKSKEIVMPNTNKNQAFFKGNFGFTETEQGILFDATQKQRVVLKKRGIVVMQGVLQLNKVTIINKQNRFHTRIFSEISDMFLALENIKVSELDWSAYDHTLNKTNVSASWSATSGTGYWYPLIERGLPRLGLNTFRTTDLVPYVYAFEIFKKAFDLLGFTIDSTYINSARFKNYLFGYGGGELQTLSAAAQNQRKVLLASGTVSLLQSVSSNIFGTYFQPVKSTSVASTITQDLLDQYLGGEITILRKGNYRMTLTGTVNFLYSCSMSVFKQVAPSKLQVLKNGSLLTEIDFGWFNTASTNVSPNMDINISVNSGDVITYQFQSGFVYHSEVIGNVTSFTLSSTNIALQITSLDVNIVDGDNVDLSVYIPDITCADFIIGMVKKDNLMISDPDENKVIKIEPMTEYYLPTSTFTDVSSLVDEKQEIEITSTANKLEKKLSWMFKKNKDFDAENYAKFYESEYGDFSFNQQSYYTKGEKKVELPFSTIIPYEIISSVIVPRFVKKNQNGTYEPYKGEPRLMFRTPLRAGAIFFADSNGANQTVVNLLPLVHHFDNYDTPTFDMNFRLAQELYYPTTSATVSNSYNTYYFPFIQELTSKAGKLVKMNVKLNAKFIKELDFRRLVMYNGALFRLNSVSDFEEDLAVTSKVELIKVLTAKKPNTGRNIYEAADQIVGFDLSQITTPVIWSGVVTQYRTENPIIEQTYVNNFLGTITPIREDVGVYFFYGFNNLGLGTELTSSYINAQSEAILTVHDSTTVGLVTKLDGVNSDEVLPTLEDNKKNFVITVKTYI